jgi:hypothetical protein
MTRADARTLRLALGYEADELLHAVAAHCAAEIIKGSAGTVSDELILQHCGRFRRRQCARYRARGSDNGVADALSRAAGVGLNEVEWCWRFSWPAMTDAPQATRSAETPSKCKRIAL